MYTITLFRGTNIKEAEKNLHYNFNDLTWWTDNYETIEHYYEGAVVSIEIDIEDKIKKDYIASHDEFEEGYTFGYAEMNYPSGAIWYSFSKDYILSHYKSISVYDDLDYIRKMFMYPRL